MTFGAHKLVHFSEPFLDYLYEVW